MFEVVFLWLSESLSYACFGDFIASVTIFGLVNNEDSRKDQKSRKNAQDLCIMYVVCLFFFLFFK